MIKLELSKDEAVLLKRAVAHFLSDIQPTNPTDECSLVSIHDKLSLLIKK